MKYAYFERPLPIQGDSLVFFCASPQILNLIRIATQYSHVQDLFHSFVRRSHLVPDQLPGEHTGGMAAYWHFCFSVSTWGNTHFSALALWHTPFHDSLLYIFPSNCMIIPWTPSCWVVLGPVELQLIKLWLDCLLCRLHGDTIILCFSLLCSVPLRSFVRAGQGVSREIIVVKATPCSHGAAGFMISVNL